VRPEWPQTPPESTWGGSTNGILPGQTPVEGWDAFVVKLAASSGVSPTVNDGGVVNNASFVPSPAPVAPGSIAAVFGSNLNDGPTVLFSSFGPDGKLVTSLGGASVTINNVPAPIFYSTPGQLGIQIPFELEHFHTWYIELGIRARFQPCPGPVWPQGFKPLRVRRWRPLRAI